MSNPATVLDEAFRCVEAIGYENTVEILKKAQSREIKFENKIAEKVITLVAEKTGISVYEILHGNGRKNERKYAIGFCALYLHSPEYFNIDIPEVAALLLKDESSCYRYSKMVTRIKPICTSDKKFLEIKIELDTELAAHAKKMKK
jgi:hypothetical protein